MVLNNPKYNWTCLYYYVSALCFTRAYAFQIQLSTLSLRPKHFSTQAKVNNIKFDRKVSNSHSHSYVHDGSTKLNEIENVERIFAISDLHTDKTSNLQWLREMCQSHALNQNGIGPNDALIIAGDISHELTMLKETFCIIKENLNCHIFFVWGNHEAWIGGEEMDLLGVESSLQKIELVKSLCSSLGVHTDCKLVGSKNYNPVVIMPIESWYDASLSLQGCEDLCTSFDSWKWVDFIRCVWPENKKLVRANSIIAKSNSKNMLLKKLQSTNVGQIPLGLTELLYHRNNKSVKAVQGMYVNWVKDNVITNDQWVEKKSNNVVPLVPPGLITFSHFLPNQKTLPDWKDPKSDTFHREEWLDHPVPEVSAKFAKVAGSILIDEQIRSIIPRVNINKSNEDITSKCLQAVPHLHVFGHSHRPKDFVLDNVRYIHNPLGKPAERDMNMVSKDIGPQLIWDCRNQSSSQHDMLLSKLDDSNIKISSVCMDVGAFGGEIPGREVIRFWEEQGGGKEVLARKMKHRKRRRQIEIKRFIRDLELSKQQLKTSDAKE